MIRFIFAFLLTTIFIDCNLKLDSFYNLSNEIAKKTGIGGYHKKNLSDDLKKMDICDNSSDGTTCNTIFSLLLIIFENNRIIESFQNQTDIQIKNSSSYSRITFTFKDQVVILAANEISKIITVPFDPVGLYKIETSSGTVFENSSFNFRGSLKDGTIITTDGTLINDLDLAGCNLINVETGKIETVSGQCLTPTNP